MRKLSFQDAFDKLAAAEQAFLTCEFLAPVVARGQVQVRLAGVVLKLSITPADCRGFGVFQPASTTSARLLRPATLAQRRQYLELFPLVRLILCRQECGEWLAVPAHLGDQRFQIRGLAPVLLVTEAQMFDVVRTRFDGSQFWFESLDACRDPATAAWLRRQLADGVTPNLLDRRGLTPEERLAYAVHFAAKEQKRGEAEAARQAEGDPGRRLWEALSHSGAELIEFLERDDGYRVTYRIGRQQHVSAVRKDDLSVQVAGICLSGEDQKFDLASLVGVLREADGEVLRIGDAGLAEEDYWRIHPRRNR